MKNTLNAVLAKLRIVAAAVKEVATEVAKLRNPVLAAQIVAVIVALAVPLGLNVDAKVLVAALASIGAVAATVAKYAVIVASDATHNQ